MLTFDGVTYRHAGATRDSLSDVSFELRPGHITGLVGASEAGKSTLCLVAAGLAPRVIGGRLRGRVRLDDADITTWPMYRVAEHLVIGMQNPAGQLSMVADTVFEEVAFGPANMGIALGELLDRVSRAIDRVGIAELSDTDPRDLSGGQQQLVVLAGLLAMESRYLILDEPLAHLDGANTERVLEVLRGLAADGIAVLMAEQKTASLGSICDSVAVIDSGRLVMHGGTDEVLADPLIVALGIEEPAGYRLARLLAEVEQGDRHVDTTLGRG